jgi:conjugal transfer pilus assembly protein TrbC
MKSTYDKGVAFTESLRKAADPKNPFAKLMKDKGLPLDASLTQAACACDAKGDHEGKVQKESSTPAGETSIPEKGPDQRETLLVFVSLSMPLESLKGLLKDAEKENAVLVIRGLHNNSFKETATFLQEQGLTSSGGMEINPDLFATYGITKVPVFVRMKDGKEENRLSGNVSLGFAAQKLREAA